LLELLSVIHPDATIGLSIQDFPSADEDEEMSLWWNGEPQPSHNSVLLGFVAMSVIK